MKLLSFTFAVKLLAQINIYTKKKRFLKSLIILVKSKKMSDFSRVFKFQKIVECPIRGPISSKGVERGSSEIDPRG